MDPLLKKILLRQHYKIIGPNEHFAVKLCHWMRQKLFYGRPCYKEEFYGIKTHRCMQITPTVNDCTHQCIFCWRTQGFEKILMEMEGFGENYRGTVGLPVGLQWDEPEAVLEKLIEAQRLLISGFRGDERCNIDLWKEAHNPNQVAISLSGEPTLYPYLSDFIDVCRRRNMTTFLVTNGTQPSVLESLDSMPTQLYVTVAAPDEETYKKTCRPLIKDGWDRLNRTLELLSSFKSTRTAIRHTLVNGWNFHPGSAQEIRLYASLDEKADPMFIEPKGYVFVGGSRNREGMSIKNMPSHQDIMKFGEDLGNMIGYRIVMERKDSRVVLLTGDANRIKIEG